MDMPDRRRPISRMAPDADRRQPVDRGPRQGEIALVVAGLGIDTRRGRFNQGDRTAGGIQRDGEAGANQAAADDQHRGFRGGSIRGMHGGDDTRYTRTRLLWPSRRLM